MINSTTPAPPAPPAPMRWRLGRLLSILAMAVGTIGMFGAISLSSGCRSCSTKPSEKLCQEAIANIRKIRGTTSMAVGASPRKAIRSCQGNATRESVKCFLAAKDEAELQACTGESGSKYLEQERKIREEFDIKAKENAEKEAAEKAAESEDN